MALRRLPRSPLTVQSFLSRESPSSLPHYTPFASPSNPFLPSKASPLARSWTAPKYSLRRQKQLRVDLARQGLPSHLLPPSSSAKTPAVARTFEPIPHLPKTKTLQGLGLERKGPYGGRKVSFKGKIWERKYEQRQDELEAKLTASKAKVDEWRKSKNEERSKGKSNMPF